MTAAQILGAVLSVWGALGMYVAGKGRWHGWAMGLAIQPVWVVFALVVHSWPLMLSSALYGSVYVRNLWRWKTGRLPVAEKARVLLAAKVVDGTPMQDMNRRDRRAMARRALKQAAK